jgi:uncharacterized repeat protein (TIGR02543 family)
LGTGFQSDGSVNLTGGSVTIPASATIKISGGTLTGNNTFGVVTVQNGAYLELEAVTISGGYYVPSNSGSPAGGVTVSGGELLMKSGARITGNKGFNGGGVQVVNSGVLTMNSGSEVSENTATNSGGGVWVGSGGRFTLENGGKISDNLTGNQGGGGVYVGGGNSTTTTAVFTMNGGEISANRTETASGGSGGGVQVANGGAFTLEGGKISGNIAYHLGGGGVYVGGGSYANPPAVFTMNGGEISLNRAATIGSGASGGGVYVNYDADFIMNGGKILNNQAEGGDGGGLYSTIIHIHCQDPGYSGGTVAIKGDAVFSGNTAKALYEMTNDHETLYSSVVASGAAFSFPVESASGAFTRLTGFNNFDIGYYVGTPLYYPPVFTISFAPNGGSGQMDPVFVGASAQGYSPPYTYPLPANRFSRTGYQFTGWLSSADNQEYGDGHVYPGINQDILLTAQWRATNSGGGGGEPPETITRTYTVSFDGGGGDGAMESATVTEGGEYTLPPNAFTRTGYSFNGWLANDAESTEYADGAIVGYIVQDIQLTAQWRSETAEHTVSFDGGGGAGAMESVRVADGDDYTLPPNVFTRSGYTFLGWLATDADNTWYADEATIENIIQDIELTALWRANDSDGSSETQIDPSEPPLPTELGTEIPPDGNNLIPGDDGVYIEVDETGIPQGAWHWDEEVQEWVFEPYQPLADLPKTGGSEQPLWPLLAAAFAAGAFSRRLASGQRRAVTPKE